MSFTKHQKEKIKSQMKIIEMEIALLQEDVNIIKKALVQDINNHSKRIKTKEKDIELNYLSVPEEIQDAIKSSGLDKKVHQFYNLVFRGHPRISRMFSDHIEAVYRTINYIINLIVYFHPEIQLEDRLKSLKKSSAKLHGNVGKIVKDNSAWIEEFKDKRRICGHKSAFEYTLQFQIRKDDSTIHYVFVNNHDNTKLDMFEFFNYLSNLKKLYSSMKSEIDRMISS